jgi:hypothetical protein
VLLLLDEQLTPFGYATIEIERKRGRERAKASAVSMGCSLHVGCRVEDPFPK